jgi:hypothetical protein
MSCLLIAGYTLPCKGIAGIQQIWVGNWTPVTTGMYTFGTVSGTNLNQITSFSSGFTASTFSQFQQEIEQGSLTETGNFNPQNGTAYYDQVVEITVFNQNQTLFDTVDALGRGRWRIIVLDQNGNYFLVGLTNPVSVSAVAAGSGKAYSDLNGFTITFTGKEYSILTQVTPTAFAQLTTN